MRTPQHGIFALGTRSHHHLQLDLVPGADLDALVTALRRVRDRVTTVSGVNAVVGIAADVWARINPAASPHDSERFADVEGDDGYVMPADQHDLWLWFHSSGPDLVFDAAFVAVSELDGLATVAAEWPSFTYGASRDLTGFEDGTENPPLDEATTAVQIPDDEPGAGGSIALLQRWVHDLAAFHRLSQDEQERVIGRTKDGSRELDDDVRPASSHISRVVIEDADGDELEVFRRSTAFGGVGENGLVFLAFSSDTDRLARMLRRMAGAEDGVRDALTRYSRPDASAWYVVPAVEDLTRPD